MILPQPSFSPSASPDDRRKAVKGLVASLNQDKRKPILLGPWRSELGFEALYWQPFLRWLGSQVKLFDQRACVVTRGGLAPLYRAVASQGYDLYALRSVEDVRRENLADQQKTGIQKQLSLTDWDEQVLTEAAKAMGIGPVFDVVHPSWMYWALSPYWDDVAGIRHLSAMTLFDELPKPARLHGLPEQYVAVKWYGRATFPYPERDISQFIQRLTGTIAAQIPVVVVSSGGAYDDHLEPTMSGQHIVNVPPAKPEENLCQQAAIMAHAKAVVGTYGGTMQLALRMGVPSVSFYKAFGGTAAAHLSLSQWISRQRTVPFLVGSMSDTHLWSQVVSPAVLPVVQAQMPQVSA